VDSCSLTTSATLSEKREQRETLHTSVVMSPKHAISRYAVAAVVALLSVLAYFTISNNGPVLQSLGIPGLELVVFLVLLLSC
jgi:hypothetical protein